MLLPRLDPEWNRAILKCLEQDPGRRFSTAGDLVRFLEHPAPGPRRRVLVSAAVIASAIALGSAGAAWWGGLLKPRHDERWLRAEIIPELHRLADADRLLAAHLLAMKANAELPGNPLLVDVWHSFSEAATIRSQPAGARVSFRDYQGTEQVWHVLGTTPFTIRFPRGYYRVRFELEGHRTVELGASTWSSLDRPILLFRLSV